MTDLGMTEPGMTDLGHTVLVGAGNMGGAMLARWPAPAADHRITVIDPGLDASPREGVALAPSPDGVAVADTLVVAVKPQSMGAVLPGLAPLVAPGTAVVSVAAGTTVATLSGALGTGAVVRTIPNTPAMVGAGAIAAWAAPGVTEKQRARIDALLASNGLVAWLAEEADIDRATAVSGSGPAYVFHLVEALAGAARGLGLGNEAANALARQTVVGAGALLAASDEDAGRLRERVTSPGGTTAAALGVLMAGNGLAPLVERAVGAAHARAIELGKNE